jgi:hypothetical protein
MDLSYNEDKEKRRRLTVEKTIRCCGQGENMEKYGFGVDVGGTSCKLGLFTDSGKLMEKWEIPTDTSEQGEHIIEHVAASLEHRQRERGLADEQIIGVGIDTPGIAGRDGVVRGAVNLGWEACPVQEQLKMRLQKKVCVCNDANAAAPVQLVGGCERNRIYADRGTGTTLTSGAGGFGGKTGLYQIALPIKVATKEGFQEAHPGDSIDLAYPNLNTRRGRVGRQIAHTVLPSAAQGCFFIDLNEDAKLTDHARCITTRQDNAFSHHKAEKSGVFVESEAPRAVINPAKEETWQNGRRIKAPNEPMFTLTVTDRHGIIHQN